MKIVFYIVLVILSLLAISSGVAKVMLLPQDLEFFGGYGFTSQLLIVFGMIQILGGILLVVPRSRMVGGIIVASTFLLSVMLLILASNLVSATVTLIFVALLIFVVKYKPAKGEVGSG